MYGDENEVEEGAKKETICYFCMKKRRKADMRFISSVKKEFIVEEVEFDMGEMGKGVFL